MFLYLGWALIALAGILLIFLLIKSIDLKEEEKIGRRHPWLTLISAASWVLGCVIVGHYHMYWYLYVVNAIAAGKSIVASFTGRPWG